MTRKKFWIFWFFFSSLFTFLYDVYVTYILKTWWKKIGKSIRMHKKTMNSSLSDWNCLMGFAEDPWLWYLWLVLLQQLLSLYILSIFLSIKGKKQTFFLKIFSAFHPHQPKETIGMKDFPSIQKREISLFTNSCTIWGNFEFFSEDI